MQSQFLFLVTIILLVHSPRCYGNVNSLAKVFSIMQQRLNFSMVVAAYKLQQCRPIEDLVREEDILNNKTAQANLTLEEMHTFFNGQIEANKLLQYKAELLDRDQFPNPIPSLESLRAQIDSLDKAVIPLIKPALDELKNSTSVPACLDAVKNMIGQNADVTMNVAVFRAASLFIETCLKAPLCKVSN